VESARVSVVSVMVGPPSNAPPLWFDNGPLGLEALFDELSSTAICNGRSTRYVGCASRVEIIRFVFNSKASSV
jgi:hypothetical protein